MKRSVSLVMIMLMIPLASFGKDLSSMYDSATLAYWKTRYPANAEWNFENLILAKLKPDERAAVGNVTLRFPLTAEGGAAGDPFAFYASALPPAITMPILSIKFLDDLSVAFSWLEVKGFSTETVTDYLAMLKYKDVRDFPGGRYPAPFAALHIPDNALDDPMVDDLSQKILKSAIVWIMAHELAHIYYRHQGYQGDVAVSQENEKQADRFANEILRRIGVPPIGMSFFFLFAANYTPHRGDFGNDREWKDFLAKKATHPLTSDRLQAIASDLGKRAEDFTKTEPDRQAALQRVRYTASQIAGIATLIGDPEMQKSMRAKGLATDLDPLALRKKGELPRPSGGSKSGKERAAFDGGYAAMYGHVLKDGRKEELPARVTFTRTDNMVYGRYAFGMGEGTIEGAVQNEKLYFEWQWADSSGKGVLMPSADGTAFTGTWGYGELRDGGGTWSGRKK